MANLLQSSQVKSTCAPQYYTNYLSNLACKGATATCGAQYVGAQPLQCKAFCQAAQTQGQYQAGVTTGQGYIGCAAKTDVTGAAAPFTTAATTNSPLCTFNPYATAASQTSAATAANPYLSNADVGAGTVTGAGAKYLCTSAANDPSAMAANYMGNYAKTAAQAMSDIAHRNIAQNLTPQAIAAAVGSGQFGSQRGSQVLGQIKAQAEQCLNNQIAAMMNQGYANALSAAGQKCSTLAQIGATAGAQKTAEQQNAINAATTAAQAQQSSNALQAQLGQTASAAQQAQNQANLTAAQIAEQAATNEANILNQAGQEAIQGATAAQNINLACMNALSTLGAQQQKIKQCEEMFPLTKLEEQAKLLQGYSIPVGAKTVLCMSPLAAAAAIGSTATGIMGDQVDPVTGQVTKSIGQKAICKIIDWTGCKLGSLWDSWTGSDDTGGTDTPMGTLEGEKRGGLITYKPKYGCQSSRYCGALPYRRS